MIAEILLVMAGHSSSLFLNKDSTLHPDFAALLHPGEKQSLESLGMIACRYRNIKDACRRLSQSSSRYVCALCAKLRGILKDEYESLVVSTEAKILQKDESFVGHGSFVPLSAIRATFSEWDSPLAALEVLLSQVEARDVWPPGELIDLLLEKSNTGVHRISRIISQLAHAVQRTWKAQLQMFLIHGGISPKDPLLSQDYEFLPGAVPSCVSPQTRSSIVYVGRAIATLRSSKWHKQIPASMSIHHTRLLDSVMPQDLHNFDDVVAKVRLDISEWLWSNVLTIKDVEDAVDFLGNYFLMQNGEFGLALIHEITRLRSSRLTARSGSVMITEQDLHHALLRASVGTSAQVDPLLPHLKFTLPSGAVRPLLATLEENGTRRSTMDGSTRFDNVLLGSPLKLNYEMKWPLNLVLQTQDITAYTEIFSFLSAIRYIHTRVHTCWSSLSNSQRARRRWTGLDEGGTQDSEARMELLRCGWGIVRLMGWFFDVFLGFVMNDVVENEFRMIKKQLKFSDPSMKFPPATPRSVGISDPEHPSTSQPKIATNAASRDADGPTNTCQLDFTTLRNFHIAYIHRLKSGCLLTQPAITMTIREIMDVCERFLGQIERWGGDVLPALLFEGSISSEQSDPIGKLVQERRLVLENIYENIRSLLDTLYDQLSSTTSLLFEKTETSMIVPDPNLPGGLPTKRMAENEMEMRRHVERLLLRMDFNRSFSKPRAEEVIGSPSGGGS